MKIEAAFWILMAIIHLPLVLIPIVFCRLRHRQVVALSPLMLALSSLALITAIYSEIVQAIWIDDVGLWFNLIYIRILLMFIWQSLFFILLWCCIGFYKNRGQLDLAPNRTTDSLSTTTAFIDKDLPVWKFLLSQNFAVVWVLTALSYTSVILVLAVKMSPHGFALLSFSISSVDNINDLEGSLPSWRYAEMAPVGLPILVIVAIYFKMGDISGQFRIKEHLVIYLAEMVLGLFLQAISLRLSDFGFDHGISCLVMILVCDTVLATIVTRLLSEMSQSQERSSLAKLLYPAPVPGCGVSTEEHFANFEQYLQTESGFNDFRRHLEREFAVENLLFWRQVLDFKQLFAEEGASTSAHVKRQAWTIYFKYLSPSAPLELNLPSDLLKRYRADIFHKSTKLSLEPNAISPTMFDDAAQQTLQLMQYSSMVRYVTQSPEPWKQFVEQLQQSREWSVSVSLKSRLSNWSSKLRRDRAVTKACPLQRSSSMTEVADATNGSASPFCRCSRPLASLTDRESSETIDPDRT